MAGREAVAQDGEEYALVVRRIPGGGSGYLAEAPDLPGAYASGVTEVEALEKAREACRRWIETAKALGISPPPPGSALAERGNLKVRVPASLHRGLAKRADEEGISFNELNVRLLVRAMTRRFGSLSPEADRPYTENRAVRIKGRAQSKPRFDDARSYPGNWLQRLPPEVHRQLHSWAKAEKVGVGLFAACLLSEEMVLSEQDMQKQNIGRAA